MANLINHIEIPSPDINKAIEFYSKVFGWETQLMPDGKYAVFKTTEGAGGGFDTNTTPAAEKTGPGIVINVDDINPMLEKIKAAGGKVFQEKTDIGGGYGFYARFIDPNGNHMQIYSKN